MLIFINNILLGFLLINIIYLLSHDLFNIYLFYFRLPLPQQRMGASYLQIAPQVSAIFIINYQFLMIDWQYYLQCDYSTSSGAIHHQSQHKFKTEELEFNVIFILDTTVHPNPFSKFCMKSVLCLSQRCQPLEI